MRSEPSVSIVATAIVIGFTGVAQAQDIDGIFQPSGSSWSCDPEQIGIDGGAVAIQSGVINGVENRCNLTQPKSSGTGTSFVAVCSAEGTDYSEPITISPTADGVRIERNGSTANWTRCEEDNSPADVTQVARRPSDDRWSYVNRSASIVSGGNALSLSCETFNPSSTYPTANLVAPCPTCFPGETTSYVLRVDDQFAATYEFTRINNAEGSESDLDYYPDWYDGIIAALMAGSRLDVVEGAAVIASFPLTGSSDAIMSLRTSCN